nr:cadherin domain-containing protein [uncultured Sphingosinicella sp.]
MSKVYYSLASGNFSQDWSTISQITANDDWSGVPSIVGYLGQDITTGTGIDPRTLTTSSTVINDLDVIANQTNPNTLGSGGVAEFHLANPTIALNGSGTADAPNIVVHLDASGRSNINVSFNVRDLDGSADNAVQQVALQYRTSATGEWKNVPGGYVADATVGGTATLVTAVNATLPADANNAATLELRILTTNAAGNDEWVGIDDIVVTSQEAPPVRPGNLSVADASVAEGNAGASDLTFTVSRDGGSDGAVSATWTIGFGTAAASDLVAGQPLTGSVEFADGQLSATITVRVAGDTSFEGNETFTVTLSAPTGGASIADAQATGTIVNDDVQPPVGGVFINEIHYDNAGGDVGEAIEIAAPAGTNLSGWTLVLYNGSTTPNAAPTYSSGATINLTGTIPNQDDGFGTLSFNVAGLQNGTHDGFALVDPSGRVVQFLSYEGVITASNGPAAGLTSTDIGVSQGGIDAAGLSLQLTGAGADYGDFTWVASRANSFGTVNAGQDFIGGDATGLVFIGDASVVEGDTGVQQLVFTVRRAGGLGQSASVEYFLELNGSANQADFAGGQPLSGKIDFASGVSSMTVTLGLTGDTAGEANETFNVRLANPAGNISIMDGTAVGTIVNDDPITLATYEIQGARHTSEYVGQPVVTSGIVTAVDSNGFYLQDPKGDGNRATSDALFVFTGAAPKVAIGDAVQVSGKVSEFLPGGNATSLTITQLNATATTVISSGNALPAAVLIGTGGVLPPTETIDDDGFATFDPQNDGIDFYESLEGMRVTIEAPLVVANTSDFGETFVVASGGAGATGVNSRGGITISEGDYNPEKIQIDADSDLFAGYNPAHSQGDRLSNVTGVVSYSFNSYEVLVTEAVAVTADVTVSRETTTLAGDRNHLTIASFNVENLDPTDSAAKFDLLAQNIVYSLKAPDIIAVQEIQDADGAGNGTDMSGQATAQMLIDAIEAAGGPTYVYVEIAPAPNSSGGEPGGNIRNGYFYNPERVSYIVGSAAIIQDPAFNGTRKPLVADFLFNGETVRLVNVHFTSRGGSDPLWGSTQPPADAGDSARAAQGAAVDAYVTNALATDPSLNLGVLGDFNGFWFEDNVTQLEGGVLTNLHRLLPEEERYSYLFDGNLQALDNFLVSGGLLSGAQFDAVHINAELPEGVFRATDHDPTLGRFFIEAPNEAPTDIVIDDAAVDENAPAGTVVGTVSASDIDEDVLEYSLSHDADGLFDIDAVTGRLTTTAALDFETRSSYQVEVVATDPDGEKVSRKLTISVNDLNEAPVARGDAVAVDEDATSDNLWSLLLGNDSDPDAGDSLVIHSVDGKGALGSLIFDAASQTVRYVADADAFDALAPGQSVVDRFTYTVTDSKGLTSTATVEVTVTGIADGVSLNGGNGHDNLFGTGGEDSLFGGNGNDVLQGLGGHDRLFGNNGVDSLFGGDGHDTLAGGNGDDYLTGGAGKDSFFFARGGGKDTILDFEVASDRILLDDGIGLAGAKVGDVNGDGIADLTLAFTKGGGTAILLGVNDLTLVDIVLGADESQLASHPLF